MRPGEKKDQNFIFYQFITYLLINVAFFLTYPLQHVKNHTLLLNLFIFKLEYCWLLYTWYKMANEMDHFNNAFSNIDLKNFKLY